jgi:tetratricopeptide (TPR) repeat protein
MESKHGYPPNRIAEMRSLMAEAERNRQAGKLSKAKSIVLDVLKKHPDYHAAWHTLGLIEAANGDVSSELAALTKAAVYNASNFETRVALAGTYFKLGAYEQCRQMLEEALPRCKDKASAYLSYGTVLQRQRDYEGAKEALQKALQHQPGWKEALLMLGGVLNELDSAEQACNAYTRLLNANGADLDALYGLSQINGAEKFCDLKGYLKRINASAFTFDEKVRYHFCSSDILRIHGDIEDSWRNLVIANQLVAKKHAAEIGANQRWQEDSLRFATSYRPKRPLRSDSDPATLFILGPSRSGKTTVERAVAADHRLFRGYETNVVYQSIEAVLQSANCIIDMQLANFPLNLEPVLRKEYLNTVNRLVGSRQVITMTGPSLIHQAARIPEILPNSYFVFVKRSKPDLAYKIYSKHYSSANYYAYQLPEVYRHIDWYEQMIDRVSALFPENCLTVTYDEFVRAPNSMAVQLEKLVGFRVELPEQAIRSDQGVSDSFQKFMAASDAS